MNLDNSNNQKKETLMLREYGFNYEAYKYYKNEALRLERALKKINDSITITGSNTISMSMSIFELKDIIETALGDNDINEQKSQ